MLTSERDAELVEATLHATTAAVGPNATLRSFDQDAWVVEARGALLARVKTLEELATVPQVLATTLNSQAQVAIRAREVSTRVLPTTPTADDEHDCQA